MKTILIIFSSISTFICLVVVSLNALGIYLLCATNPLNNSTIILINLASSAIANSVVQVTCNFLIRYFSDDDVILGTRKISSAKASLYYFAMYLLTVDRLIATINPFKYRIFVTKKRLTRLILVIWTLVLILGISFFLSTKWFKFFEKYMWIVYDMFFSILCSTTYGLIFFKLRFRRWFNNDKKFFKITSFINLSFFILILIPDILYVLYAFENVVIFEVISIFWLTGMMVDPIIYIFMQPDLRSLLKSKCCRTEVEEAPRQQETAL